MTFAIIRSDNLFPTIVAGGGGRRDLKVPVCAEEVLQEVGTVCGVLRAQLQAAPHAAAGRAPGPAG